MSDSPVAKTIRIVRIPISDVSHANAMFCFGTWCQRWALSIEVMENGEWKGVPMVDGSRKEAK